MGFSLIMLIKLSIYTIEKILKPIFLQARRQGFARQECTSQYMTVKRSRRQQSMKGKWEEYYSVATMGGMGQSRFAAIALTNSASDKLITPSSEMASKRVLISFSLHKGAS